ncbi:MAG: ZIP family metal transporter [Holophagales bacterium]|jgi:zinc transporter ZupT|nr:ZIP family metal transporter [Holophagales bacterium]
MATLFGGWLVVRFLNNRASVMRHISGIAAGYLVSVTIIRILPEALHTGGDQMALWVIGGFFIVHVIEHGITPHFHYGEESHEHEATAMAGIMALLGLSLHSFLDGMSITAAMRTQSTLGILVFIGVLLHRIPEGATISSIFLVSGFGTRSALLASGVLAVMALLGAFSQDVFKIPIGPVLAVSAGLGLYVACADLLPQAQKERGWKSTISLAGGVLLFVITSYILPHDHEHKHEHSAIETEHSEDKNNGHVHER